METHDVSENTSKDSTAEVDPSEAILGGTIALHNTHSVIQVPADMIMLTDLYFMLNRRGVPLQLFELLSKWAWDNRK
jgi:hypothetical protein